MIGNSPAYKVHSGNGKVSKINRLNHCITFNVYYVSLTDYAVYMVIRPVNPFIYSLDGCFSYTKATSNILRVNRTETSWGKPITIRR